MILNNGPRKRSESPLKRKMASITVKALSVFSRSPNWSAPLELAILINEIATVPPNNSNTSETGSRSRHPQRVKNIQQHHIGEHDSQQNTHNF